MYLNGLDELDQKIIQLLIENSRISYSDIGEKTGISRVAVKARIQALEKKGVIEEYTTIINPQKISGGHSATTSVPTVMSTPPSSVLSVSFSPRKSAARRNVRMRLNLSMVTTFATCPTCSAL